MIRFCYLKINKVTINIVFTLLITYKTYLKQNESKLS